MRTAHIDSKILGDILDSVMGFASSSPT